MYICNRARVSQRRTLFYKMFVSSRPSTRRLSLDVPTNPCLLWTIKVHSSGTKYKGHLFLNSHQNIQVDCDSSFILLSVPFRKSKTISRAGHLLENTRGQQAFRHPRLCLNLSSHVRLLLNMVDRLFVTSLCGVRWFETDVSRLPIGPIFKGQTVEASQPDSWRWDR